MHRPSKLAVSNRQEEEVAAVLAEHPVEQGDQDNDDEVTQTPTVRRADTFTAPVEWLGGSFLPALCDARDPDEDDDDEDLDYLYDDDDDDLDDDLDEDLDDFDDDDDDFEEDDEDL